MYPVMDRNDITSCIRVQARRLWALGFVLLLSVGGCATETRVIHSTWGDFADWFAAGGGRIEGGRRGTGNSKRRGRFDAMSAAGLAEQARDWSILIRTFESRGHKAKAGKLIKRLRQETNMASLWSKEHEGKSYVYRGKFAEPEGFAAKDALRQTRMVRFEDGRPFQEVAIARIVEEQVVLADGKGTIAASEMDLQRYVGQDLYSLQVGAYDITFGKNYRKAAQQYATLLREGGVQAFYCHRPEQSMVTVGLFTRAQAFIQQQERKGKGQYTIDRYSPTVRELQLKHRYNLVNGRTLMVKAGRKAASEQPSFLVRF